MEDNLDALLNRALAEHNLVAVPEDLEERVLRKMLGFADRRRSRLTVGICAAVIAAKLFLVTDTRPTRISVFSPVLVESSLIMPVLLRPPVLSVESVRPARHAIPKQQTFPAPVSLSSEERLLASFAQNYPEQARAAFAHLEQADQFMKIDPIIIPPIEVTPGGTL